MKFNFTQLGTEIYDFDNFSLEETFSCGQCFRWSKIDGESRFTGVAFDRLLNILEEDNRIILLDVSEEEFNNIWREYFDLDFDYNKAKQELLKISPLMKEICDFSPGIRILNQEHWETLCSFIISQNNNIPRIKSIVNRLCVNFGECIDGKNYTFPKAERIAKLDLSDLDVIKSGFRSRYIYDAAKKVFYGEVDFNKIKSLPFNEAKVELMKINGVGPKVSECTLLYGLHRMDAFPIDVWMKRAMKLLFPGMKPQDFGMYSGIAQQYIFHYSRMHPNFFRETY